MKLIMNGLDGTGDDTELAVLQLILSQKLKKIDV